MNGYTDDQMKQIVATMPKFYNIAGGLPTPTPWLPETAVNGYTVTHQGIDRGFPLKLIRGGFAQFDQPITLSVLRDPSGDIWMSDSPSEILDALDLIPLLPSGHILIGGLGIGLMPWLIHQMRPDIHHMTIVDINPVAHQLAKPRIDELTDSWGDSKVTTITADFREYITQVDPFTFDGVLMDIWGNLDYDVTLHDMMSLWTEFDLPGAIWGADLCLKGLADLLRLTTPETAVKALYEMGFDGIARCVDEQAITEPLWLDGCYPAMIEAATDVYGYPFLNLDEALEQRLQPVSPTSRD